MYNKITCINMYKWCKIAKLEISYLEKHSENLHNGPEQSQPSVPDSCASL